MSTTTNQQPYIRQNISGGMQNKSTKFMGDASEVDLVVNGEFSRIGGVQKMKGMSKLGNALTETTTSTTTSTSTSTTSSSTTSSSTTTA